MEHNLLIMETRVDRFRSCLPVSDIQPTPKPGDETKEKKGWLKGRREKEEKLSRGRIEVNHCEEERRAALQEEH